MTTTGVQDAIERALDRCVERLVAHRTVDGAFRGRLSTSALSTALAVFALWRHDARAHHDLIERGLEWLARHANADGGYGDTPESPSNLSTTLLALSALNSAGEGRHLPTARACMSWLRREAGGLEAPQISEAVLRSYGEDRTFSAPILTVCALSGLLGDEPGCWRHVPQLPLELSLAPRSLFGRLRLQVVSYALPALVAIGLARHSRTSGFSPMRVLRSLASRRALEITGGMQPENGGFLEAVPLTAFVSLGLEAAGFKRHPVVRRGVGFLRSSARGDGGWPIDTDLSTWLTTLSVNALHEAGVLESRLSRQELRETLEWLLAARHRRRHPFTGAAPGGWAWTDLPGGVPDADDTAGALLAIRRLDQSHKPPSAVLEGVRWLLGIQNADGGFPTFCRGWGRLPFDRSCPDITAHAVRAFAAWRGDLPGPLARRTGRAVRRAMGYLKTSRLRDGSWLPLWFGNQYAPAHANPTYGTAQVVTALADAGRPGEARRGCGWLISAVNEDGGWGGAAGVASTIEETALAVGALAAAGSYDWAARAGARWLIERTGGQMQPVPIGLYFASLWYSERLYPLIFTTAALGRVVRRADVASL